MILIDNQTDEVFSCEKILQVYESITNDDIELLFVDDETIKQINFEYRNKNTITDVLSFPFVKLPNAPIGSIVICLSKAKEASLEFSHSLEDELTLLFIHGLLHLLGFDHENDDGQMRKKEEELIEKFLLPKSLIIRNEIV